MKRFYVWLSVFLISICGLPLLLNGCGAAKASPTYSGGCVVGGNTVVFTGASVEFGDSYVTITQDGNEATTSPTNCFFTKDAT